jgi:hypothetical protein
VVESATVDRLRAVEELGDEDGGVALCLGTVNPLQRRGANLHRRGHVAWAGANGACRARRAKRAECIVCGWFNASGWNRLSERPEAAT